uniref:pLS20_p028 family conjugation system transmembrane protein n=1 Tax=Cytobacillus kochii TaxID=859143 RepID=UPI0024810B6F
MSEAEIIDLLIKYREHLTIANLLNAPFRVLAWLIISGLAVCADALSGGLKEVYKLMNFFNSDQINDFIDDYIAIILALASLAFAWLGWKIIVLNQTDLNKVVTNTLVAVTLFVVLPWAMVQAEKLTSAGVKHLDGDISTSTKIISSNITDLYVIDDGNWKKLNPKPGNYIKDDENVSFIDITETVDTGGFWSTSPLSDKGVKILEKKVNDSSGEYTLEKLKSHFFTDDEAYYRYSWNPIFIMIELATVCLVFIFTIFKTTQLIIELGVLKILTQATALTDVETGQRNKKLIEKIRNTFIILYIIMLLLNIYLLFVDYISTTTISDPVKLLVILAAAFLVIDGPNFIEELFGIDAGLRSASRTILGLLGAAKGAQMATSAVGKGLKTAGKALKTGAKGTGKLLGAAGTIGAGAKGALDGYKENKNNNSGNRGTGGSSLLNANGNQNVDSKENNSSRQENNRNDATPLESQNQQNNDSVESLQTGNESPSQNGSPTVTMTEGNTPLGGAKDKQQRNSNSSNFNANGSGSHLRREESQNTNQPSGMFRANEMGNTPLGNPESNNSGNQMQNNSAPNVNDVNVGGGHTLGNGFNANNGNTPLGDNGIQKSGGKGSQGIPIKGVGSNSGNTGPIGNLGGTQQGTPISGVGSNSGSTGPIGNLGGTQQGTPISGVGSNSGSTGPIGNL